MELTVREVNRRRKCDETKPQCLRCLAAGKNCRYEYVEYSESEGHRIKRTKPAPRNSQLLSAKESRNVSDNSSEVTTTTSSSTPSNSISSDIPTCSVTLDAHSDEIRSGVSMSRGASGSLSLPPVPPTGLGSQLLPDISIISSSMTSLDITRSSTKNQHMNDPVYTPLGLQSQIFTKIDLGEDAEEDNSEDVRVRLCMAPTMDKNAKDNTLPFVLHCYSQWATAIVFEPLKIMHAMRAQVIAQFSLDNTRSRTILVANVMNMFVKNFTVENARTSLLHHLTLDVQKSGAAFMATPRFFVPALDRQNAIRTLDSMLEIITLQLDMQSASNCVHSIDDAAPVFRRACPDPPGRPVNLANVLLDLSLNLRYFPTIDIVKHLTTGQPLCFQYEVPFSLELCERIYQWQLQGNYGLQWLFGFPDQFILLFAWINGLSVTPGACDNLQLITWIEELLPQIEIAIDESGDPALRIGRMVVQEGWRFAVQIYLYMFLCNSDAHDPRVVRAQKDYMRLVQAVRPGRNPDLHLIISMAVVGIATIKEQDREILRRRILNVREYSERGTAGNDLLLRLEDIWTRTRDEGRAAVWSDLPIAYSRLTGL